MREIPSISTILQGDIRTNTPLISPLTVNLITIAFAILENGDLATPMFIYILQSIIIGIFTVLTLLTPDSESIGFSSGTSQLILRHPWIGNIFISGFFPSITGITRLLWIPGYSAR